MHFGKILAKTRFIMAEIYRKISPDLWWDFTANFGTPHWQPFFVGAY